MAWQSPYYDPELSHHTPQGFQPPVPQTRDKGDFDRWQRERREKGRPHPPAQGYDAFRQRWWQPASFETAGDVAWWLGHASVLLRIGQLHVLTDPMLTERASPVPFAGPKRCVPVPAGVDALPPIDVVLISHNHYDHLDKATVRRLARRFPDARFLAPLGLARWLRCHGRVHQVQELDWWQDTRIGAARFTCVPAQHWSQRTLWDRNRTLWSGWVMQAGGFRFYFAGDTGYAPQLQAIGDRLGPFDLAAIPIGAYAPRWFMRGQHVDPAEAVQLHRELRCRRSLAIHWGTFELTDEPLDAPPHQLDTARREQGVDADAFRALPIGGRWPLESA